MTAEILQSHSSTVHDLHALCGTSCQLEIYARSHTACNDVIHDYLENSLLESQNTVLLTNFLLNKRVHVIHKMQYNKNVNSTKNFNYTSFQHHYIFAKKNICGFGVCTNGICKNYRNSNGMWLQCS